MMLLNYGIWALIQGVKKDYVIFLIFTLLVFYFKWSNVMDYLFKSCLSTGKEIFIVFFNQLSKKAKKGKSNSHPQNVKKKQTKKTNKRTQNHQKHNGENVEKQ